MFAPHDLTAFIAFADGGSIREAAIALGRTQPAITQAIQRLEVAVGFPLLDRSEYRAKVTERGELFLKRARIAVKHSKDLKTYARVLSGGNESKIRMAVQGALSSSHWMYLVADLPERFPDTVLEVHAAEGEAPLRQLKNDEVELAVVVGAINSRHRQDVDSTALGEVEFVTVAQVERLSTNPDESLATLPQIIVADFDDPKTSFGVLEGHRFWRVSNFAIKAEAIMAGLGWGAVPLWLVKGAVNQGLIRTVTFRGMGPSSVQPVYLCRKHQAPLGPVADSVWQRSQKWVTCLKGGDPASCPAAQ